MKKIHFFQYAHIFSCFKSEFEVTSKMNKLSWSDYCTLTLSPLLTAVLCWRWIIENKTSAFWFRLLQVLCAPRIPTEDSWAAQSPDFYFLHWPVGCDEVCREFIASSALGLQLQDCRHQYSFGRYDDDWDEAKVCFFFFVSDYSLVWQAD